MLASLQRLIARIAAIAAIVLGAAVAIVLALVTLVSGLLIGSVVAVAAWFGARSRRRDGRGPFDRGGPGGQPPREGGTVIDVEMREVDRDEPPRRD